jgi:hypothetical protein
MSASHRFYGFCHGNADRLHQRILLQSFCWPPSTNITSAVCHLRKMGPGKKRAIAAFKCSWSRYWTTRCLNSYETDCRLYWRGRAPAPARRARLVRVILQLNRRPGRKHHQILAVDSSSTLGVCFVTSLNCNLRLSAWHQGLPYKDK